MSMAKTFRLTAWDALQLLSKRFSDQQVRMVVEFDGRLDEGRLAEAIRGVVKTEPVLACRVRRRFFRPGWEPMPGLDAADLLRVVRVAAPGQEVERLLVDDLDPWHGPIVRFGLVRGEWDTLVVNLDHTAGDAASVRLLTCLLASLYTHPERAAAPQPAAYYKKRGFRSLLELNPSAARTRKLPAPPAGARPGWQFPWRSGERESTKHIFLRRLAPEKAAAVRAFAAARNAWLNDVLIAAFFRALARLLGDGAAVPRLTVPVDLRKYLPPRERPRIANFAAPFIATLGQGLGASLDETLARVRAATAAEKQGRPGLAQAAALSALVDRVPYRIIESRLARGKTPVPLPPPWFIALGALRPESFAFGPVAARYAYPLPSVGRAEGAFQLSVSYFADSMTLAVCFTGDAADEELVNRFFDHYLAELP
jgi:NRPS condensation-like uncharacterized protein